MNLIIDTDKVQRLGMTLNEYLVVMTAYYQEVGELLDYTSDQETLKKLEDQMFIKITPKGAVLREKGWKLFEETVDDKFIEFLKAYPQSVPSDGGKRITAPVVVDSHWANQLRRQWNIMTNNNLKLQEEIIAKLKFDVEDRTRTAKLMYMPKIDNWLEKRTWENIVIESFSNPYEKSI